jgi:hypothetical protein
MCGCPSLWYTKCSSLPSTASSPQAPMPSAYSATSLHQAKTRINREVPLREWGVPSSRSWTQRARTSRRSRRRPRGTCGRARPRGPQPRRVWSSSPCPPRSSSAAPRHSQRSPAVREPRLLVGNEEEKQSGCREVLR